MTDHRARSPQPRRQAAGVDAGNPRGAILAALRSGADEQEIHAMTERLLDLAA